MIYLLTNSVRGDESVVQQILALLLILLAEEYKH